jgi:hypothetical protein
VTGIDTGAGAVTFDEPVTVGFVIKDREDVNEVVYSSNNNVVPPPSSSSNSHLTDLLLVAILSAVTTLLLSRAVSSLYARVNDCLWKTGSRATYEQASTEDIDMSHSQEQRVYGVSLEMVVASPVLNDESTHSNMLPFNEQEQDSDRFMNGPANNGFKSSVI